MKQRSRSPPTRCLAAYLVDKVERTLSVFLRSQLLPILQTFLAIESSYRVVPSRLLPIPAKAPGYG